MHLHPLTGLEERAACCREILHANNTALGVITRIQEALAGAAPLGAAEVRRLVTSATVQTYRMAANLARLTGRRHTAVLDRFAEVKARIVALAEVAPVLPPVATVVPLGQVGAALADAVGQKSALLGEAGRILGDLVPAGFAISAAGHHAFMAHERLGARIGAVLADVDLGDVARCFEASARITSMIDAAPLPPDLEAVIGAAAAGLPGPPALRLAVRSSAVQEGGPDLSFAGQYRSFLNVPRERVAEAYKGVVASKYAPEALTYRHVRGYEDGEIAMCCCVLAMVDARAAGVLYTSWPTPVGRRTLVHAVHGLGIAAVDGSTAPETSMLDPGARTLVGRVSAVQSSWVRCGEREGTERRPLERAAGPVLSEAEALRVAEAGWRLEAALGAPVDVEWALGPAGELAVLQVRPQHRAEADAARRRPRAAGVPVLVAGGCRACGGAASGRVVRIESDLDLVRCPPGAVVVARDASPRLAVVLPRAAALVADLGEATSHLAVVARELRVPALLGTRRAMAALRPGVEVTVDADAGVVYEGRRAEVLGAAPPPAPAAPRARLAAVADLIVPLTLRHRLASGFSARRCRTLHDLIRYCHQATIEAMFETGDQALRRDGAARRLRSGCPIDCRVIDLGGGLRDGAGADGGEVTIEDVTSRPMVALWRGMTDPRLAGRAARPVSRRGFMSSVVSFGFDEDARVRELGEPSYAFITREYLSLNSRIGYHFATVDARIDDQPDASYLSFRFVGGSTGVDQRSRRALVLERLLVQHGFETDRKVDLVNARIRRLAAAALEEKVRLVGMLIEFVNHLDMALTADAVALEYVQAFERGDYGYGRGTHA
ncbi:MAG TPA: PEP/pyruvate-binding domain-containing protein [Polyangia bacterium]|jgi:pyruvate,water dikinase